MDKKRGGAHLNYAIKLEPKDDLVHSAKGTTWKDHKYIKKVDGRYIYDTKTNSKRSDEQKKLETLANKWETEYESAKDEFERISDENEKAGNELSYLENQLFLLNKNRKTSNVTGKEARLNREIIKAKDALARSNREYDEAKSNYEKAESNFNALKKKIKENKSAKNSVANQYKQKTSNARKESELEKIGRDKLRKWYKDKF